MTNAPLPRIDLDEQLRELLLPFCRLAPGKTWNDPSGRHKVGCIDISEKDKVKKFMDGNSASLAIQDPPYNFIAFGKRKIEKFINWCREWIDLTNDVLRKDAALYIWLGADQNEHFQPLPQFMEMMESATNGAFSSRNFITMRNQRGYGTQKNWMSVRQELLYYVKRNPVFNVEADYTGIPKILRGYYKSVNGKETENFERSKSENIRAGNVWVDIQQVFYRMEENINGCYAQKPLNSIERIVKASSNEKDIVIDFFSHSGTTLIVSEKLNRKCFTIDIDPVFCEITIRRLERFREKGLTGWQNSNPFENEIAEDKKLRSYLKKYYKNNHINNLNSKL